MAGKRTPEVNGVAGLYELRRLAERGTVPCDDTFRERWPYLFSILVNNRIDDKRWTEPLRLSVQNANGDWQISLSSPGLSGYVSTLASTFDDGLTKLDRGLADGTLKWSFNLKRAARARESKNSEK